MTSGLESYQLELTGFRFPEELSNNRANFRFLVDLRYVGSEETFLTEHAVMPSLDTFWECDERRDAKPNYVRAENSPCFEFGPGKIDEWDQLIMVVRAERLHSIQFKVIDVDRRDAWDRVKSFLGGAVRAVVGRAKDRIPAGAVLSNSLGGAADDVQSFLLKRLAGGDKVLFRGSHTFRGAQQDAGVGEPETQGNETIKGNGSEGDYCISFSWKPMAP